jgi:uncharacterized protein (TIGR03435 family)
MLAATVQNGLLALTWRFVMALVMASVTVPAHGQAVDKPLTFDAASIKPATPLTPDGQGRMLLPRPSGGPGTQDPGRIHYPYMTLRNLLTTAYDMKTFQVVGPGLLDTERFDITATMPPDTTKEQFRAMLQNPLAERFKMTSHRETKELPMYSLVVARNGPRMKESTEAVPVNDSDPPLPPPLPSQPKIDSDGFPVLEVPAGAPIVIFMMPGRARMFGRQKTMLDLADRLTGLMSRPVTDATALRAKYDFTLTYSPEGMNGPMGPMPPPPGLGAAGTPAAGLPEAEPLPDIFGAVQAQLGLRLEPRKGPVELIVIDHVEKTPTEN